MSRADFFSAEAEMLTRCSDELSRNPGGRLAWILALITLAVPTTTIALTTTARVILADTLPVVPTVVQMYHHGTRDLSRFTEHPRPGRWDVFDPTDHTPYCVRRAADGTGKYSSYPAGMEVFAWPLVLGADVIGLNLENDWNLLAIEEASAAVVGGMCVALFFLIALRIGSPAAAWVTAFMFATGSVVHSVLTQLLWQQTGVVFWMLVVLLVELRDKRPGIRAAVLQGIACSLMLACRPSAVTFLIPFGIWVLLRDVRRGALVPVVAAIGYLPWAAMYWAIYHTPFGPSMTFLEQNWTPAANVLGVLLSPGRGLFIYQPWMWLTLLLLVPRIRRDPERPLPSGWYAFALAVMLGHVILVGSWGVWWGGYTWGSRLASEVVPLAALLAARPVGWLLRRWCGVLMLIAIAIIGIMLHTDYTYGPGGRWNVHADIDQHPEMLWNWKDVPFVYHGEP
jgi:hypothetical protein